MSCLGWRTRRDCPRCLSWNETALVASLQRLIRVPGPRLWLGDAVVLDNPGAHRASRIEEVAETRGGFKHRGY